MIKLFDVCTPLSLSRVSLSLLFLKEKMNRNLNNFSLTVSITSIFAFIAVIDC